MHARDRHQRGELLSTITLDIHVEETTYEAPTQWRLLGGKGKAENVIALCARQDVAPQSLLEVGAGEGAILRHLGSRGFCPNMHAVEISRSGVEVITAQNIPGLVSCQTFDGYSLPFEDDAFDLVILSHVLEHVEFERALLREIRRVSRHQVIEIPMDHVALGSAAFHFLGPSYGHINAHSPAALRFLLATEGFAVLDDQLGGYSQELCEYDYFVNNKRDKTPDALEAFRARHKAEEDHFAALSRPEQENRASFYAVLTKRETDEERRQRALGHIKDYISTDQLQPALLVFKHVIPAGDAATAATDLADHALEEGNAQAAQEFANLALEKKPGEAKAQAILDKARAMLAPPQAQQAQPVSEEPPSQEQKQNPGQPLQWLLTKLKTMKARVMAAARALLGR